MRNVGQLRIDFRAVLGIEPRTSSTRRKKHTTRSNSRDEFTSPKNLQLAYRSKRSVDPQGSPTEVAPGIEPRSGDSESPVLSTTPRNRNSSRSLFTCASEPAHGGIVRHAAKRSISQACASLTLGPGHRGCSPWPSINLLSESSSG